jgi:UDP-glucose 4-epimerase
LDNFSNGNKNNLSFLSKSDPVNIIEGDIRDRALLEKYIEEDSLVFHLAALADIVPSIEEPKKYFEVNVDGTFNLLDVCSSKKIKKFLYIASSTCYGFAQNFPTSEIADISPQYPYALTKWLGEELAMHWGKVYKLPIISLRFFNVYGTRSRTSGTYGAVFGVFLAQKLAGLPYTIVGDGEQKRDFTYVSDVVDAMILSAESNITNQIFNVASGSARSINEVVNILGGAKVYIPKRPGEPEITFGDISKIEKELGWKPKIDLETGISLMIKEIEYWSTAPVWTPEKIAKATESWFKLLS